jgi:hypothetical protein
MQPDNVARDNYQAIARNLECRIYERTHGRISGVRVEVLQDRLIVHGCTKTYHVKQLALAAIGEMSTLLVELDIQVDATKARADAECGTRLNLEACGPVAVAAVVVAARGDPE